MRNAFLAFATTLLLVLAWQALSLGVADHYASSDPQRALWWRGNHPEALLQRAYHHAEAKEWVVAKADAEQALRAQPIDGRSLRVLAQVAEHSGNPAQALALYRQAVQWAPRDLLAHYWLLQHALQQRDARQVAVQLDILLRLQPELLEPLQAQANLLAVTPAARPALLDALAASPSWRAAFLAGLAQANYPSAAIAPFFAELKTPAGTPPEELDPWLARLRREGHAQQAFVTWANRIPAHQRAALGNVFDGGFEIEQGEQPGAFAWQTPAIAGAMAYWSADRGTIGDSSYVVEFEGRRTPFAHLSQALVLPAGDWQLQWRAKGVRLETPRGLVWQIRCDTDGALLAESAPMQGQFAWAQRRLAFSVPPNCEGQQLLLRIPARAPAETVVSGALWLDEVSITPNVEKFFEKGK